MKYIFDFDDVLFHTSEKFKKHIFSTLEKVGILNTTAQEYLEKERLNRFSMKKMLAYFNLPTDLYGEIMKENKNFTDTSIINTIKKLGKENCFILTYGDEEFQRDKIQTAGVEELFSEIIVVPDSKKEALEHLCAKYNEEQIIYIDDEPRHFQNLDFNKCPNLKTILFTNTSQLHDALLDQYQHK